MATDDDDLVGLPPAAVERVRHQRASGVRGSLLSAPAAAAVRSAGLEPVGEVFGCVVLTLGWGPGGCGYGMGFNRGYLGAPGTFGGGIAGGVGGGGGGVWGYGLTTPVVVSGDTRQSGFAWSRPYAAAVEGAWADAHGRMLVEARALGADGVLGITRQTTSIDGAGHEYASLGTAVRHVDPALRRPRDAQPWAATLTGEDCAAAASAGFLPAGVATGYSIALKHEDYQLRQQRSAFANTEVTGLTELLAAARGDARRSLTREARRLARGGELVVTASSLQTAERPCGEERDMLAEALFVGTVLAPHPGARPTRAPTLTVLPLTPPTAPATRRGR